MSTCKGCKKPMEMGVLPNGTNVPIDTTPAVYQLLAHRPDGRRDAFRLESNHHGVNHFATCSAANKFNAELRKKATAGGEALHAVRLIVGDDSRTRLNMIATLEPHFRTIGKLIGAMQIDTRPPELGKGGG